MKISMIVLYTDDIAAMDRFYGALPGRGVIPSGDGFHLYPAEGQVTVAAWLRGDDGLASDSALGGAELLVEQPDRAAVDAEAAHLRQLGLDVDGPRDLPFGYVATLTDPSGNAIRVGHFPEG